MKKEGKTFLTGEHEVKAEGAIPDETEKTEIETLGILASRWQTGQSGGRWWECLAWGGGQGPSLGGEEEPEEAAQESGDELMAVKGGGLQEGAEKTWLQINHQQRGLPACSRGQRN